MRRFRRIVWTLLVSATVVIGLVSSLRAEWVYSVHSPPEVLLRFPLPDPGAGHPPVPGESKIAQVLLGTDGYVRKVRFNGSAPEDSVRLSSALRRWVFRPARRPDSTGSFRPIEVWVAIPIVIRRTRSGRNAPLVTRPDSLLRSRLLGASTASALRLLPPTSANFDSLRSRQDFVDDRFAGSLVAETRVVGPKRHAALLLAAIDLALAGGATDSLAAGCPPEPDYALRFAGTNRTNGTDVLVSLRCDFVQIRSPEATLLVPVQRMRDRLVALEAALFRSAPD